MKRKSELVLKTLTDIKVYILFLLDNTGGALDGDTLTEIIEESTGEITFDYGECIRQMVESEHIIPDTIDDKTYYIISKKGRMVASELYDSIDESFRERSLRAAIRHISFSDGGRQITASITEGEDKRFHVTLRAHDRFGEVLSVKIAVNSRAEAEAIKSGYEAKPDAVYRGVLFSLTGRFEYIS
ncbi:MAG: DUF4364 family protein [Clostridia bacterium]|nr:DUF4364 family protein [Clostridia bacterium]